MTVMNLCHYLMYKENFRSFPEQCCSSKCIVIVDIMSVYDMKI